MKELNDIDTSENSTLDSLIEGFQLISFDWRYLYVNKSVVKQSKLNTKKDLLGFTMMEKFPGIEKTELFKVLQECMETRVSKIMENEFTFPDNSKGWFELRIEPVPKGIFILSMDITESKKSEADFRESEEKYRLFFEHNLDAIFLTAPDGSILDANPKAIRLFGYTLVELRQKGRGALIDVNDPQLHSALLERKKTGKFRGELTLIRKDGIKILCEISTVIYKNSDSLERTHLIVKDITEKKKAEEKLNESFERFKYATLASNEIIYDWDIIHNTLWWNESYYKLMNLKNEGKFLDLDSWTKFIHPDDHDKVLKSVMDFLDGEENYWSCEYRFLAKNKDIHNFSDRGFVIRDKKGKPLRMIGAVTDITYFVKTNERIRNFASYTNQILEDERSNLAREIHDELGQRLAGIKIGISFFKKLSGIEPRTEETITELMNEVDITMQSLRKIATELRPGILDTLGLIPSIKWLVTEFEKKKEIKCNLGMNVRKEKFEKNISTCFFRICQESLTNISKHAQAIELKIKVLQNDKELLLEISDNGKGIASDILENPFSMGLLGMHERANIIGAKLNITSKKDFGTTVQIKTTLN